MCRDLNKILLEFEHSLAVGIIRLQLPPGILAKHPGLHTSKTRIGFKTLDELCTRMYTLFRIERNCHNIRRRGGKEAAWMRPEWVNLQQAGMHLLYRLHDVGRFIYRFSQSIRLTLHDRQSRNQIAGYQITTSHVPRHPSAYPLPLHTTTSSRRPQPAYPDLTPSPRHVTLRSRTLLSRTHPPRWAELLRRFTLPLSQRHLTS